MNDKALSISLPDEVKHIINTLEKSGYNAYAVGGCVRDSVMGRKSNDWDISTSALPEQTKQSFSSERIFETGIKHGTVSLLLGKRTYEITTFRTEGLYSDNRRPDTVRFVSDLKSDLNRRDFTINALAYHPKEGLIDHVGAAHDIRQKLIRCVGDPDKRFSEDALRIMRAIRFSATLGFEIENATKNAITKNRKLLEKIAVERISAELDKLLVGENVKNVLENHSDVMEVFIPEISPMIGFDQNSHYHHLDVWFHTVKAVASAPPDRTLRLVMLLHDIAKPQCYTEANGAGHFYGHPKLSSEMAAKILRRLKYDTDTIDTVTRLVLHHDTKIEPNEKVVKRWLCKLGEKCLRMLCAVKTADAMAKASERKNSQIKEMETIINLINQIIANQECFTLKDLAINGNDLIKNGISEGKSVGETLSKLLDMVIDGEVENNRDKLLEVITSPD